jgi:RNA polymerase sigma-70 factor (ECF subfamily)
MATSYDLAAVIEDAQRGRSEAFDVLVDLYASRLYGFLYRLTSNRDDAQELVQEVFVRVVRTIERYEHDGRFEAWLFRIAANLARDRIRRIGRAPGFTSLDAPGSREGEDQAPWEEPSRREEERPGARMETEEDLDRLQAALAKLPDAEREVVMLRHYSDLSFGEIAELMGTPLGTALARAHRGLNKLRSLMEES